MNGTSKADRQARFKHAIRLMRVGDLTWREQARGAGEVLRILELGDDGYVRLEGGGDRHNPFDLVPFVDLKRRTR